MKNFFFHSLDIKSATISHFTRLGGTQRMLVVIFYRLTRSILRDFFIRLSQFPSRETSWTAPLSNIHFILACIYNFIQLCLQKYYTPPMGWEEVGGEKSRENLVKIPILSETRHGVEHDTHISPIQLSMGSIFHE